MTMLELDTAQPIIQPPTRSVLDPVHYSDLVQMSLSPAHYRASVARVFKSTTEMRVGTIVHELVLGPHRTKPLIRYDGDERKGNKWKDFEREMLAKHPGCEIVTDTEWERAEPIAAAVQADPVAAKLLDGTRREVKLQWDSGGIACETDGIDVVGRGYIADLKRTSCTEPGGFARHAARNNWHCQGAFYEEAARLNGIATDEGVYLIGVEPDPPYAVTVMRFTPATLAQGRKSCIKWLELLRACRSDDHWPTYTQTIVDFDLPPWMDEQLAEAEDA